MKSSLLLSVLLLLSCICLGQSGQDTILQNFSAVPLANSIELNWTIKKGNTCNGINILRSSDSLSFSEVGNIPGICGSPERAESYNFSDINPIKNQRNHYRLELGFNGLSDVISVDYFELGQSSLLLFPNPTRSGSQLIFQNLTRAEVFIEALTSVGEQVWNETTENGQVSLPSQSWDSGLYIIKMYSEKDELNMTQKLLVIER